MKISLRQEMYKRRLRIVSGFIFLIAELVLLLGSGVLGKDVTRFLTGEGSWEEEMSDDVTAFGQRFMPRHKKLHSVSFLMDMGNITSYDGLVTVSVRNEEQEVLFEKELSFSEIADGSFTDVEIDLSLSTFNNYYLILESTPSSLGEYPSVGLCGSKYRLSENRGIVMPEETKDAQFVDRFMYRDALTGASTAGAVFCCLLTAIGIIIGFPDSESFRKKAVIVLLALVPLVLGYLLEHIIYNEILYLPNAFIWNVGLMYAFELVVWLITHSPSIAIVLSNTVLTIVYSANYFVMMYRGTPLRVNDLTAAATAVKVVGNYSFVPNGKLAFAWAFLILFIVYGVQLGIKHDTDGHTTDLQGVWSRIFGKLKYGRLISYVLSIGTALIIVWAGGHLLIGTDMLDRAGFSDEKLRGIGQDVMYYFNGYLIGTCVDIKNSRITEPEGYSADRVEELLKKAESETVNIDYEELPHIILIMNESFSDLRVVKELNLSQENLTFINSLKENTIRGYVNASVLGGGTANSEFEVFTGCTVAFFPPNYYPYQQALRKPVKSLVSSVEKYGYTTYSMHPESANNWNRKNVYNYYGFDESFWKQDFEGAEVIHSGVSDAETYNKIIKLYEERDNSERMFVFDLTMQNHGGYPGNSGPYEVRETELNNDALDEYLSLMKISDEAFEELTDYFEKQDEKVIICMFGDHQPYISDKLVEENADPKKLMDKFKTPFIIWANYDIDEADGYDISMNYLGGLLLETAGVPLSPYFEFLKQYREIYPIITLNGYVDGEGNYSAWGSEQDVMSDYRILQYDYLYKNSAVDWGY